MTRVNPIQPGAELTDEIRDLRNQAAGRVRPLGHLVLPVLPGAPRIPGHQVDVQVRHSVAAWQVPSHGTLRGSAGVFTYQVPANSLTVMRVAR